MEIARLATFSVIFFYAAINIGFLYSYKSQVNEKVWINAFYRLYSDEKSPSYPKVKNHPSNQISSASQNQLKDISIPLGTIPDSTSSQIKRPDKKNIDTAAIKRDTSLFKRDTTAFRRDTLGLKKDTVKLDSLSIDSTARLKYFKFQRESEPYLNLGLQPGAEFFAQPSEASVSRKIEIDSTGKYVDVVEVIGGQQFKVLLHMPIEDYINMQLDLKEDRMWNDLANVYNYKGSSKELGEVLKSFTKFDIPLPSIGVLSIFGKPKISLQISGSVDIHGAWLSQTTQGVTASLVGNTTNQPNFQQQVQINVNGTIGDKLNINADWNTERTFVYQNQLKIKYTGYEDEIIQSIEAGNVSLQTSPLVGGSDALFGVKAQMKMGPLILTTLASQKKGEIKEVSVNSGTTSAPFILRAYNYANNNYFLDTVYASEDPNYNFFYNYYGNPTPLINPNYRILNIEVWKSTSGLTVSPSERKANAYLNLPAISKGQTYPDTTKGLVSNDLLSSGQAETGRFIQLQKGVDYVLHPETGYITINTAVQDQDAIAVAYQVAVVPNTGQTGYYGEFVGNGSTNTDSVLVLKLIKPRYLKSIYAQAWKLLLKNIYSLGAQKINQSGFTFKIKYEIPGQSPVTEIPIGTKVFKLLNTFGLDLYDQSGNSNPDDLFDWRPNVTILPDIGEVIFPRLRPFGSDMLKEGLPDSIAFQAVYDTTSDGASNDKQHDKWELVGQVSGQSNANYSLGFNVVEKSVRVTLNGRLLTENVDYTVDYNIGQLTILNQDALAPGAGLKITFEQNDLFQLASKTLLGARGVIDFSKDARLGFSILNLNQQTLSDKVRIGEEPMSNTIMGVDFQTTQNLPFLTAALDHVFSTKAMSSLTFSGEYAYIKPNPNTKTSTITDDNGQSVAYIDDFEGTKKTIPIGVSYTTWKDLSPPDKIPAFAGFTDSLYTKMMDYKAKSFWYDITPSDVSVPNIWGTRKAVTSTNNQVPVMDFVFMPDTPGTYNYQNIKGSDPTKTWGGMMTALSSVANNLQAQNIRYIEFWMHVNQAPPNAKLYIDLGRISEDVIPNNKLDTEDKSVPPNNIIDPGEDIGIDGMTDDQERQYSLDHGFPAASKTDPSGDNFSFNQSLPYSKNEQEQFAKYFNINGTQGNSVLSDIGRIPDKEDLNYNNNLDQVNSYFRYAVPLDTNMATNKFIAGGGNNAGWYLIRVPLKDTALTVGQPSLSDAQYIRVFCAGETGIVHVRFAEFNLTGNQWQTVIPNDTIMTVSVVNVQDNTNYSKPPGLKQERDYSNPNQTILLNEQSMDLIVNGLQQDYSRAAVKYLSSPLDIFNYKQMRLFIHGDETPGASISDSSGGGFPAIVYFRFGTDTNNFYEYSQPVKPNWNDVIIDFSKLTAFKSSLDSALMTNLQRFQVPGQPGHYYGVKGNPSLTSVSYLTVGITNVSRTLTKRPRSLSGEVWVDELRVLGANNHPGSAYSFSTSLKLADIGSVNFNIRRTDPYFHGLSDRFGSRANTKSWSMSADLDLLKFIPLKLEGSNLRISYSHSESLSDPLYLPGTDIQVSEAANLASDTSSKNPKSAQQIRTDVQTINISDTWSASNIGIKIPSSYWLIRDTFNALNFGFNYNKNFSRNPTILSNKSWVWNASMNYGISLSPDYYIVPAKIPYVGIFFNFLKDYKDFRIYYTPQTFALTFSLRRNQNIIFNRQTGSTPPVESLNHDFAATRGFNFLWKMTDGGLFNLTTNYSVSINSSLDYLQAEPDNPYVLRRERDVWRDIFTRALFGKDYQYQQTVDFRLAPKVPSFWDLDRYLSLTAGYSVNYQWNNVFSQRNAGRSAGFSNRSTVGMKFSLKSLMDPLLAEKQEGGNLPLNQNSPERENIQNRNLLPNISSVKDSLQKKDTLAVAAKRSPITEALLYLKAMTKFIFFDYEAININFSNDNSLAKNGLAATGTGLYNFWGLAFNQNAGPSRLFMLGLSSNVGNRVAGNLTLSDIYSQKNDINFSTSKPLWEGARVNLNWDIQWSLNNSKSFSYDSLTRQNSLSVITATGTTSRSFFSLPPIFLFKVFNSGIKRVKELYDPASVNPSESLSNAFTQGFESLPWLSKLSFLKDVISYIPRPNWSITWDGLEKIYPFKVIAERATLEHTYSSTYTEGWYITPDGSKVVQTQRVSYGFNPLIGINMTFTKIWNGNFSGNVKYSTTTSYDLGVSTQNISESNSRDIGLTLSYSRAGFEMPLFGISLKNDVDFSLSYTSSQTSAVNYDMNKFVEGGVPQNGLSRVIIQPRLKYTISSRVTLSIFYTRTSTQPVGASISPPMTSNEAGLDVRISIQ